MNDDMIALITAEDFDHTVRGSAVPVLVYFYRPLCHGCQRLGPTISELNRLFIETKRDIPVYRCDNAELMRRVNVFFVPQVVLFVKGEAYWIERSINTPDGLEKKIEDLLEGVEMLSGDKN